MVRLRFIQALLLTITVTGGIKAWQELATPSPDKLRALVDAPLRELFGPEVTYDWPFELDFSEGVTVSNLRVPSTGGFQVVDDEGGTPRILYGLEAARVRIEHDPIALAAGRYRPRRLELDGATIITHETEGGIARDFPLDVSGEGHYAGRLPDIEVRNVTLLFRAMPDSRRLRPNSVQRVVVRRLELRPGAERRIEVDGVAHALGLGQDETPIQISGHIMRGGEDFKLEAAWDPLRLTPELMGRPAVPAAPGIPASPALEGALAEELAAPLRQRSITSGRIVLRLDRTPGVEEGALGVRLDWDSEVEVSIVDLPGVDSIDLATMAQLQELFGSGAVKVEYGDGRVDIKKFVTELAGGRVEASGHVVSETGEFRLNFEIKDLQLEDPAVRRALGEDGAALFEEFDPKGVVDAFGYVARTPDGEVEWSVNVLLEGAELMYIGSVGEDGRREGFPYRISDVNGRVRIRPGVVLFDGITGWNRGAEVTILSHDDEAWTGGETGRIRLSEDGADVRLTVVAHNVPMDDEVITAIKGSEFSEMLDEFEVSGVIDKIELDLIKIPTFERTVKVEMRLTLLGEQFRYIPFPLPLEDVRGRVTMRRPVLEKERGRTYAFDVTGWAEGAPVHVRAASREHEGVGRLVITADGLPLAGGVSKTVLTAPTTAEDLARVWRWLDPRGKARIKLDVPLGEDPDPMHLEAELQDASIRLNAEGETPLEISSLRGNLEVKDGGVHLQGLVGTLGGAPVTLRGEMLGGVDGTWDLSAHIEDLRLTPSITRALVEITEGDSLLPGGLEFEPGSRMSFELEVTRQAGEDQELEIEFVAKDLDTVVRLDDGSRLAIAGRTLEVRGDMLRVRDLKAETDGLEIVMPEADVRLGEKAEFAGRFSISMDDYALPDNLMALLPESISDVVREWTAGRTLRTEALRVDAPENGPVTLRGELAFEVLPDEPVGENPRGRIRFDPLVIDSRGAATTLRGQLGLHGFSMDVGLEVEDLEGRLVIDRLVLGDAPTGRGRLVDLSGRIEGIRVTALQAPLDWSDDVLRIPSLSGELAEGDLTGRVLLHTAEPIAYEGALTVRDFDLRLLGEDLAPTGPDFAGSGLIQVTFQNRGGEFRDLTAAGSLHVRAADLGELPAVANIFRLFDEIFQAEEKPKFNRADVRFVLEREIFKFSRLDLSGPLFDMPGKGSLDLAGTIDLRFTPDFIKGMLLPGVMQLPLVGPVLHGVLREELLYAVRIRGDLDDPQTELEALPPLGLGNKRKFAGTGSRKMPPRRFPRWFR